MLMAVSCTSEWLQSELPEHRNKYCKGGHPTRATLPSEPQLQFSQHVPRGLFLVFEGLDRSGKSTQVDMLIRDLRIRAGRADVVQQFKFPGWTNSINGYNGNVPPIDRGTPTGQAINAHLTKQATLTARGVHELYSLNRWEKRSAR